MTVLMPACLADAVGPVVMNVPAGFGAHRGSYGFGTFWQHWQTYAGATMILWKCSQPRTHARDLKVSLTALSSCEIILRLSFWKNCVTIKRSIYGCVWRSPVRKRNRQAQKVGIWLTTTITITPPLMFSNLHTNGLLVSKHALLIYNSSIY